MKTVDIIAIIDRSGSMTWGWEQTINAFKKFIKEQQAMDGEATITLAFFDHEYVCPLNRSKLEDVDVDKLFSDFPPRGTTALNDAICETILDYDKTKSMAEGQIVIIVTDGGENASTKYTHNDVKNLREIKEKNKWEFVMMGDSREQAMGLGIKGDHTILYDKSSARSMDACYFATCDTVRNIRSQINSNT